MNNEEELKDIVVFYHGGCPDGFGAAYSAWKKFGERASYLPLGYEPYDWPVISNKEIFFLDITPTKEILLKLLESNKVMGIDHHKSTKDELEILENKIYSSERSGAYLSWQYFNSGPVPQFIQYVSDYDTWAFKMAGTREIDLYLRTIPFDFNEWDMLNEKLENETEKKLIISIGTKLMVYIDILIKKIIEKTIRKVSFEGHDVYTVNSPALNELTDPMGHHLSETHPPFSIIWCRGRESTKVSLRGNGSVDVSKLAEKYGGGGHHNAAGFEIPDTSPLPWKEIE